MTTNPKGWKLAPADATEAMVDAAVRLQGEDAAIANTPALRSAMRKIYAAMLAAAPEPPVEDLGEADALLTALGLAPERFRTEGGWLNVGKVAAAIKHPADYAGLYLTPEHAHTWTLRTSPAGLMQECECGKVRFNAAPPTEALAVAWRKELEALIQQYWTLAYDEGNEGRQHDTPDGAAGKCWADIQAALASHPAPSGDAEDVRRYRFLRDWFLRDGKRAEIDPHGHVRNTTPPELDAAIDAALSAQEGSSLPHE